MKKKLLSLLLALTLAASFTACGRGASDAGNKGCDINIASLKGPTSIGLVKLFDDSDNGQTVNKYNYSIHGTADEISTGLIKGDFDAAAVPCNLASVLYNKSKGEIVIAGINTLGVLYILEKGEEIKSVADLKGKTIYATGQGTTPEYTLRYLLSSNGLDPDKDVTIEFRSEASEVVSAVSQMESAVMMLPQPYVTIALNSDENIRVALDVTGEWEKNDKNSTVVTGVIVARKSFIDEHPKEFDAFLSEYRSSAAYANDNVSDTAALLEKFDIFKAAIAQKAIPQCNVTFITGSEMQTKVLSYLSVLFDANPASVGGKLPDENIFYGVRAE